MTGSHALSRGRVEAKWSLNADPRSLVESPYITTAKKKNWLLVKLFGQAGIHGEVYTDIISVTVTSTLIPYQY